MKNSRPEGDVWNLIDKDKESQWYGKNFKFDVAYISSEEIKDVVKDFIWQNYRTGNRSLNSIYRYKGQFKWFNDFAEDRKIVSLKEITNTDIDNSTFPL
ncbi:MAG: hypothetical protein ACRDDX_01315 [Cellulosilyticaceae bacterium]